MSKYRKFNRRLASKIMAGKVKGHILTRDGRPVRIIAWDALGDFPIVGLIYMSVLEKEMSWQWNKQGFPVGYADGAVNFTLVIELKENKQSTVPRLRRGTNKKRK